jgi:hypothetical protein
MGLFFIPIVLRGVKDTRSFRHYRSYNPLVSSPADLTIGINKKLANFIPQAISLYLFILTEINPHLNVLSNY